MTTISATIITLNEEKNIRRCLESIKWVDEIIVFDSGSTDKTLEICQQYTDKIWQTDWPGYGKQKQRALEKARSEWVLSIDADEEVSPELKIEIQENIKKGKAINAMKINIQLVFYGQIIRYANGKNGHRRLMKRKYSNWSEDAVHESLQVSGKTTHLKKPMYHYSAESLSQSIDKMNRYTDIIAKNRFKKCKKNSVGRGLLAAIWMFIRVYFFQRGCLDGSAGLVLAVGFAQGAFYRYAKTYYLQKSQTHDT